MEVTFTYDGEALMVLDNTCANKPTEMFVSKRDFTNDDGTSRTATLVIKDMDGSIVTTWVSSSEPHRVTGLHFGEPYTLSGDPATDGCTGDITFRLIQKSDEDGKPLEECEVYYLTTRTFCSGSGRTGNCWMMPPSLCGMILSRCRFPRKTLPPRKNFPAQTHTCRRRGQRDRPLDFHRHPHRMEKLPAGSIP